MSKLETQLGYLRTGRYKSQKRRTGSIGSDTAGRKPVLPGETSAASKQNVRVQHSEQGFDISVLENKNSTGMITQQS